MESAIWEAIQARDLGRLMEELEKCAYPNHCEFRDRDECPFPSEVNNCGLVKQWRRER